MNAQDLINALLGGLGVTLGWVMSNLKDSIKNLHESNAALATKMQNMEILVAGRYVTWDGLKDVLAPVNATLGRIESKLDHKMDKTECEAHHNRK